VIHIYVLLKVIAYLCGIIFADKALCNEKINEYEL